MKCALLVVILAVAFAGCGGEATYTSDGAEPIRSGWLNYGTKLVTVSVDGTDLLCLEREGSRNADVDSGAYSGLTCDWYGWHLKRGDND